MKTVRLSRDAVKQLVPAFASKIISREVTLALNDDGDVVVEPGKTEEFKAELVKAFGDFDGHPFRGNQWTSGTGSLDEGKSKEVSSYLSSLFASPNPSEWGGAGQIRAKLRARFPGMTEKQAKEEHAKWVASMPTSKFDEDARAFCHYLCFDEWPHGYAAMSKDALMAKCKKDHPDWTPAQHAAWADKQMKEEGVEEAAEMADRLVTLENSNLIKNVEIFASGTHNGDEYTNKDLDAIVDAYGKLDYKPALKIGHTKDQVGSPAYGYVENLRRAGNKLIADFSSMHDSVVDAIRKKAYNRVSSEIYFNFKRAGQIYPRALKAVALLGSEVPAVAGLTPLHKVQFSDESAERLALASESDLDVSNESLVAALSERVAELTTLMKEFDMKTAAQVKEELRKLNEKLGTLKKDGIEENADAIKELADQIETLAVEVKTLEQTEATAEENKALRQRLEKLEADKRAREVKDRVAVLTVPAFAPFMTAIYEHAFTHPETKVAVYAKKDGKDVSDERTLAEIGDSIVAEINAQAGRLFKVFDDKSGRSPRRESASNATDPGAELDRMASEYLTAHPALKGDYAAAFEQVCKENADLARQYEEGQNARSN